MATTTEADPKPGSRGYFKWYWTEGPGTKLWVATPHPWTALYHELLKHMPDDKAKRTASQWFHDTFGYWPGDRGGKDPVGPG